MDATTSGKQQSKSAVPGKECGVRWGNTEKNVTSLRRLHQPHQPPSPSSATTMMGFNTLLSVVFGDELDQEKQRLVLSPSPPLYVYGQTGTARSQQFW